MLTPPQGLRKTAILEDSKTLRFYDFKDGDTLVVKDLGPQISWRAVFVIEYLGPLLIHQLFFFLRGAASASLLQILAYSCITFHFVKREYETLFIHRFSHATMPLRNLFKNCSHYWILSGLLIGYYIYRPGFVGPRTSVVVASALLFLLAEVGNFYTHVVLRQLRPEGSTARGIPRGFAFDLVSCPNYLFEILAWIAFSVMVGHWTGSFICAKYAVHTDIAWLFTAVASVQMYFWAVKKHRRYRSEFPAYPKDRKALIPFIL